MARSTDLVDRLARLADDLGPLATPRPYREHLSATCATARLVFGAAAVSVAQVAPEPPGGLTYEAADGVGASEVVGMTLPAGEGLAGFVVATGQALAIDRVHEDPRFSRDRAEATGYVPESMLVVPVVTATGNVVGVLSVLDRTTGVTFGASALEVAGAFARAAATVLEQLELFSRLGPLLLTALADATQDGDGDLADGLRRIAGELPPPDAELAEVTALLADLGNRSPDTRASAVRVLRELLALTDTGRRR